MTSWLSRNKAWLQSRFIGRWTLFALTGLILSLEASHAAPALKVTAFNRNGALTWTNAPVPGVCTVEIAETPAGPWTAAQNTFAVNSAAKLIMPFEAGN